MSGTKMSDRPYDQDEGVCPAWLDELHRTVTTYRGSVHFGQVCLIREENPCPASG